jgi:hypothetical protein
VNQAYQEDIRRMAAPLKGVVQSALVGLFMASLPVAKAASIQITVNMVPNTTIKNSAGAIVTGGTAYVGSFLNGTNQIPKTGLSGVTNVTALTVAALSASTRTGFNDLFAKFVSVTSGAVSNGRFSIDAPAEVENVGAVGGVGGKSLVGKEIYVLVVDNASSPTGFLLLASDGWGGDFDIFDDPLNSFYPVNLGLSGEVEVLDANPESYLDVPASTTIVGNAGSYSAQNDAWSMVTIPSGGTSIALIGSNSVTHYWGSTYVDDGATQSVTPVIKDISNATIIDFATMSSKLGIYTVAYTSGGTTVTRTVTVKLLNPSADDDKDGLSNLLEYALGGSQGSNDSAKLPVVSIVGSEVLITFTARSDITPTSDVALSFLTTTTLSSAFQQEVLTKKSGVSQGVIAPGYEKQQWVIASTTTPKKFARLQTSVLSALSSGT